MLTYRRLAVLCFGWFAKRFKDSFSEIEEDLKKADMKILLKVWVSIIMFSTTLSFVASLAFIYVALTYIFPVSAYVYIFLLISFPILTASSTFTFLYLYPKMTANSRAKSIERNLPFAITHMAAATSSGVSPEFMFKMLTEFEEYGEISKECKKIIRNMRNFGMSSSEALRNVAERTPSQRFRDILLGIVTTVESGGNLEAYMKEMAEKAIFDYKMEREKYLKTLSTYSDIYTALLVAAPLMMLSLLATMSIIGGSIVGMSIDDVMNLMTFILLPVLNTFYIAFLHITYPGV